MLSRVLTSKERLNLMTDKEVSLESIPKYSDISSRIHGDFIKIANLVDKPIIIWKFEIHDSIYRKEDKDPNKNYMKIQFSYEDRPKERYVTGTSSYYLIEDIEAAKNYLPFRTTIVHRPLPKKSPDERTRYAYILS